jgi:C4-dicarboxylate transporter, DctQ subunit
MNLFLKRLNRIEEGMAGFMLLAICLLTFLETFLRYTISYSFPWFQEVANYTLILVTYLGAAIGVKYGTHFSMEAVTEYAPDRAAHLLKAAAFFISGLAAVLIIVYGFEQIAQTREFGVKTPAMQIPMYLPYLPIPLLSIPMGLRFFILSAKHARSFTRGEPFERVRKKDR